jgi:hypothetical protein
MQDSSATSPTSHKRRIWLCVAVSVLIAMAQGSVWEHQHDEGTTFDLAVGIITKGELVPQLPKPALPITALYRTVEANTDYDLRDAIESVTVPDYRMFHPPGYYALLHIWTKVFGTSRLGLRLPAYLLAGLALLGMVRIARRVIPEANGDLWVAVLFGLAPWVLRMTNFARPYHLALFCAVWATVAVVSMQDEKPRRGWHFVFVVLSLLGMYTLYHYAFVMAWHLGLMAWHALSARPERRRTQLVGLGAVLLGLAAGFAPWLRHFLAHMTLSGRSGDYFTGTVAQADWTTYAQLAYQDFALGDALQTLWGEHLGAASMALGVLTLPAVLWAFLGPPRRALDSRAKAFWISATLMPLLLFASDLWRGSHTIFIPKLCFGMIILFVLLTVRGWLSVPWTWLRTVGLGGWGLLLALALSLNTYTRAAEPSDMQRAAAAIAQDDSPDHLVVLSTDLRGFSAPFLLSLRDAGVSKVFVAQAAGHEALQDLMQVVSNKWGSHFRRISLVNFNIPAWRGLLMWKPKFLRDEIASAAKQWKVSWADKQGWMNEDAMVAGDRSPGSDRELWIFSPVRARYYYTPIPTLDEDGGEGTSFAGQQSPKAAAETAEREIRRTDRRAEATKDG